MMNGTWHSALWAELLWNIQLWIMINITWLHSDQSTEQRVVGHVTMIGVNQTYHSASRRLVQCSYHHWLAGRTPQQGQSRDWCQSTDTDIPHHLHQQQSFCISADQITTCHTTLCTSNRRRRIYDISRSFYTLLSELPHSFTTGHLCMGVFCEKTYFS